MSEISSGSYELVMLLAMAFRIVTDKLHEELREQGFDDVRPVHGFIFQFLSHGDATANDIAEHLSVTKQATSQIIEQLERGEYVIRQPHPKDARAKLIHLTPRAWSCIRKTEEVFSRLEEDMSRFIGADRMELLREDLRRIVTCYHDGNTLPPFRPVW